MVVGKWVTKEERFISANLIYDALADLAQILHLPPTAIGLRGKLNLAFGHGGQKGVQAHLESTLPDSSLRIISEAMRAVV